MKTQTHYNTPITLTLWLRRYGAALAAALALVATIISVIRPRCNTTSSINRQASTIRRITMTIRQQLWISLGIAASLCGMLVLALGRPTALPRSHRAAVMAVLDQREKTYTDVQVRAADPSVPQDHFASVAAVVVEAEPPAYGKIECLASDDCVLWIEALGVHAVRLPALAPTSFWGRVNQHLDTVAVPLRAWLARVGQR
jgi:hypothetical protein